MEASVHSSKKDTTSNQHATESSESESLCISYLVQNDTASRAAEKKKSYSATVKMLFTAVTFCP